MSHVTGMNTNTAVHFGRVQMEMQNYLQQGGGGYLRGVNGQFQQHQQLPVAAYGSNAVHTRYQPSGGDFLSRFRRNLFH